MDEVRRMRPLLGTFVEVGARGPQAQLAADEALRVLARAHALWSIQDPASELSRLSAGAGQVVPLSASTVRLLRAAKAMMSLSGGTFDFTVGGLLTESGRVPPAEGGPYLPRGQADDVAIGPGWARLSRPLRLVLDGMAKGFAVDCAIGAMRRVGAHAAWINAGGDLRAQGDVSLPVHRRELNGDLSPLGHLHNAAMASSGVYPASGERDERWPGLIFAPDGMTPEVGVWTVLARSAWRADALTKVAANTPSHLRAEAVARLGGHLLN